MDENITQTTPELPPISETEVIKKLERLAAILTTSLFSAHIEKQKDGEQYTQTISLQTDLSATQLQSLLEILNLSEPRFTENGEPSIAVFSHLHDFGAVRNMLYQNGIQTPDRLLGITIDEDGRKQLSHELIAEVDAEIAAKIKHFHRFTARIGNQHVTAWIPEYQIDVERDPELEILLSSLSGIEHNQDYLEEVNNRLDKVLQAVDFLVNLNIDRENTSPIVKEGSIRYPSYIKVNSGVMFAASAASLIQTNDEIFLEALFGDDTESYNAATQILVAKRSMQAIPSETQTRTEVEIFEHDAGDFVDIVGTYAGRDIVNVSVIKKAEELGLKVRSVGMQMDGYRKNGIDEQMFYGQIFVPIYKDGTAAEFTLEEKRIIEGYLAHISQIPGTPTYLHHPGEKPAIDPYLANVRAVEFLQRIKQYAKGVRYISAEIVAEPLTLYRKKSEVLKQQLGLKAEVVMQKLQSVATFSPHYFKAGEDLTFTELEKEFLSLFYNFDQNSQEFQDILERIMEKRRGEINNINSIPEGESTDGHPNKTSLIMVSRGFRRLGNGFEGLLYSASAQSEATGVSNLDASIENTVEWLSESVEDVFAIDLNLEDDLVGHYGEEDYTPYISTRIYIPILKKDAESRLSSQDFERIIEFFVGISSIPKNSTTADAREAYFAWMNKLVEMKQKMQQAA